MYPNLCAEMTRLNVKKSDIAELLGKSLPTIYTKFERRTFTTDEMISIRDKFFSKMNLEYLFANTPMEALS